MPSIQWNSFDGKAFQKLCNSLIMFEVSPFAHVFSAEGKDQGIDQYFAGTYEGKTGTWRFQDKFHNSGNKTNDFASLKRDIREDIIQHYQGEDFIVIITNVNLPVAKYTELISYSQDVLGEQGINNCELHLWHEPIIESFVTNNPVIYNWYWEKENMLLQEYASYFSKQLEKETDLRYQLHNEFIGRQSDIESMGRFINNKSQTAMAIVANGGYGKTKLCIEFFKIKLEAQNEWLPVVLSHIGFTPTGFNHLLQTKKRLLVLIDNAHEIPDIVSNVKQLIDNTKGKHKLLLTTRNTLFSEIMRKLPSYRKDIEVHHLEKLGYPETKIMIEKLLPFLKEKEIVYLSSLSKGVPNVILELVRAIQHGKQPYEISSEDSFSEAVKTIIAEAASEIKRRSIVPEEKTIEFLKLIAVISPVSNTIENRKFIAAILDIRDDKLELLINELSQLGLLDSHHTLAIKPDPYSDAILSDTIQRNKQFIEHVRNQPSMERYFENILKNLAEAELSKKDKDYFIENLLSGYIDLIQGKDTSLQKLKSIYEFADSIFFSHPELAIRAARYFISIYADKDYLIHQEFDGWTNRTYADTIKEIVHKIFSRVFTYTIYAKDHIEQMYWLLEEYITITEDATIIGGCFGYHEGDFKHSGFNPRKCCEKQLFLKNIACSYLETSRDENKLKLALKAATVLRELDFQMESYFEEATMQFKYGTGYVMTCTHTKEIRNNILESLKIFYQRSEISAELRTEAFAEFIDYFFCASVNYPKRYRYDISEEIGIALNFINEMLEKPNYVSSEEKSRVLEKANLFQRAGIQEPFEKLVKEIREKTSVANSLYEELEMCVRNRNYFDARKNTEARLIAVVNKYPGFEAFQSDLLKIWQTFEGDSISFPQVLSTLIKVFPIQSACFFDHIMDHHPDLIPSFARLVTAQYKDEAYFYGVIDRLWKEKQKYAATIFWLLSYGRNRDNSAYKVSDLDYYEYAIDQNLNQVYFLSYYEIIDYGYLDKQRTFLLLNKLLKYLSGQLYDGFIFKLFEENSQYQHDFAEELKKLLFNNISYIQIDDVFGDFILSFLENKFGFETLFSFMEEKVAAELKGTEFKYLILPDHIYENKSSSEADNNVRFRKVLRWFIEKAPGHEKAEEYIVELFRPSEEFKPALGEMIMPLIDEFKNDRPKLFRLAKAISTFPPLTESLVITMSRIAEACITNFSEPVDLYTVYGSDFYFSTGGVKSKSGVGVPFPEDVAKRDLFQKVLSGNSFIPLVTKYLEQCKARAQRDIDEEIQKDKDQFRW